MTKDKVIAALLTIIFFLLTAMIISLIYIGVNTFYMGFHNVDLTWNLKQLEGPGFILIDTASDGNQYTMNELYSIGLHYLKKSVTYFGFAIILSLMWGFLLKTIIKKGGK